MCEVVCGLVGGIRETRSETAGDLRGTRIRGDVSLGRKNERIEEEKTRKARERPAYGTVGSRRGKRGAGGLSDASWDSRLRSLPWP